MTSVDPLLKLSALGVYFHALFVSITLGFPLLITFLLYRYAKTKDVAYLNATKVATMVLAVNFALGAVTGTLVEFGLVQIWPGTIIAIATSALVPLALELIAFAMEIALLVLFIVTLGKISPWKSIAVILAYWAFALYSGILITGVNSWLMAPWGTGEVVKSIYPFVENSYGPLAMDPAKLLAVKVLLLATGEPLQAIIQSPDVARKIGLLIEDPYVALKSPYAWASIAHNLAAAILVGSSLAVAAWAYRYYKTGDKRILKILAAFFLPMLVLALVQATVFGHNMGVVVVEYNPTKFAMMEGAEQTYYNPIIAFVAYGDPDHPIVGFDEMKKKCDTLGDKRVSDLAREVGLTRGDIVALANELGVAVDPRKLDEVLATRLRDICLADLEKAEKLVPIIHISYYAKLASAGVALLASLLMAGLLYNIPVLSGVARAVAEKVETRRAVLILGVLIALGFILTSSLGWYVREVGRKPWTVYGLIYPEEVVTVVDYASSTPFLLFAYTVILAVNLAGVAALALIASRAEEIEETLKRILSRESKT